MTVERAALVRVTTRATRKTDPDIILDELAGLAQAAGAEVVLRAVQDRTTLDAATSVAAARPRRSQGHASEPARRW